MIDNTSVTKHDFSTNTNTKSNLIDPKIIYIGQKNVNNNIKNYFDIPNFNMINSSQKSYNNYPLFISPNFSIFNINNLITTQNQKINEKEESTMPIEKNTFFINQLNKEDKNEQKEIIDNNKIENKEMLNKKRKAYNKNEHQSQFASDNIIKKIRIMILNAIIKFINEKLKIFFNNDLGKGICIKQLLPINKTILSHSSVEYDKEFINKKLKEILSPISNKYTNALNTKNKDLIQDLINLEDKGKYFQELFDLSFLDCLKHISGTKYSDLLNDLPNIDNILIQVKKNINEKEINNYKYIINNYELIIEHKKARNKKKPKNNKNIHFVIN
jgi:hypothetical protein